MIKFEVGVAFSELTSRCIAASISVKLRTFEMKVASNPAVKATLAEGKRNEILGLSY